MQQVAYEKEIGRKRAKPIQMITINYPVAVKAVKSLFRRKEHSVQSLVNDDDSHGKLDTRLMIDSMEAIKFKDEDIDVFIKLAEQAEKNSTQNFSKVKICLYEAKRDYVRAFIEHLNSHEQLKYVFGWLSETFDMLKVEEIKWKREKGLLTEEEEE